MNLLSEVQLTEEMTQEIEKGKLKKTKLIDKKNNRFYVDSENNIYRNVKFNDFTLKLGFGKTSETEPKKLQNEVDASYENFNSATITENGNEIIEFVFGDDGKLEFIDVLSKQGPIIYTYDFGEKKEFEYTLNNKLEQVLLKEHKLSLSTTDKKWIYSYINKNLSKILNMMQLYRASDKYNLAKTKMINYDPITKTTVEEKYLKGIWHTDSKGSKYLLSDDNVEAKRYYNGIEFFLRMRKLKNNEIFLDIYDIKNVETIIWFENKIRYVIGIPKLKLTESILNVDGKYESYIISPSNKLLHIFDYFGINPTPYYQQEAETPLKISNTEDVKIKKDDTEIKKIEEEQKKLAADELKKQRNNKIYFLIGIVSLILFMIVVAVMSIIAVYLSIVLLYAISFENICVEYGDKFDKSRLLNNVLQGPVFLFRYWKGFGFLPK